MWRVKRKAERGKHFRARADHRESRPGNYPPARPAGPRWGGEQSASYGAEDRRARVWAAIDALQGGRARPAGGGLHLESRARPAGVEGDGPVSTQVGERERAREGEGEGEEREWRGEGEPARLAAANSPTSSGERGVEREAWRLAGKRMAS